MFLLKILNAEKTLWDWFELLVVPLALAFGVFLLNRSEGRITRKVETGRVREENLQNYFDRMEQFLLREKSVSDLKVIEVCTGTDFNGFRKLGW